MFKTFPALATPILLLAVACSQDNDDQVDPAEGGTEQGRSDNAPAEVEAEVTAPPRDPDVSGVDSAPLQDEIPQRFHGKYAESLPQCDIPSHGLFTVAATEIRFFESTGEVRNVRAAGDYAAATVFEQYGDSPGTTYAFYMRLMPDGTFRYRYDDNESLTWVRCP